MGFLTLLVENRYELAEDGEQLMLLKQKVSLEVCCEAKYSC